MSYRAKILAEKLKESFPNTVVKTATTESQLLDVDDNDREQIIILDRLHTIYVATRAHLTGRVVVLGADIFAILSGQSVDLGDGNTLTPRFNGIEAIKNSDGKRVGEIHRFTAIEHSQMAA